LSVAAKTRRAPEAVPVTIITGFLGAGKTTVLNRLLRDPALANAVVLINEFGEIGLDHLFVEKIDGDMIMMASGCLCCTIRGDLIDALENLLRRRDNGRIRAFDRLIIETTGLADPVPVLQTIMSHPYLLLRFRLDGVVTIVDAINGEATVDAYSEALKQIAVADRLVLSKVDLIQSEAQKIGLARLRARLAATNPTARLLDNSAILETKYLLGAGLYNPSTKSSDVSRWLNAEGLIEKAESSEKASAISSGHEHAHGSPHSKAELNRHGESIRAFCLVSDMPLAPAACDFFLEILRGAHGPNLLRVKGVIALADDRSRPLVIHGVQHIFHPSVRLEAWPDSDQRTRIVFIVKDLSAHFVEGLYAAFAGQMRLDAPDAQALTTSPLTPNSGGFLA
jgi:G3E family GTPase